MPITCCVSASVTEKIIQVQFCFLFHYFAWCKRKAWLIQLKKKKNDSLEPEEDMCLVSSSHSVHKQPGLRDWQSTLSNSPVTRCPEGWGLYGAISLFSLSKVIPINLVSVLQCQGSSTWVGNLACVRQAILRTL